MIGVAKRHGFLVALAGVIALGGVAHEALAVWVESIPRDALVAAILLAMGLRIDLRASLKGASAWLAVIVGVLVNLLLAPPLAWLLGRTLPEELAAGLVIAAAAPCTVASAAIWTRRGGGNEAVALAVTLATNLLCCVSAPLAIAWLVGDPSGPTDSAMPDGPAIAGKLAVVVAAPLLLSQLLRQRRAVAAWAADRGAGLATAAQAGLLVLVLIAAVRGGAALTSPGRSVGWAGALTLLLAAAATHVGLFALGWATARSVGARRPDALAAAVGGSQKTLAVGLTIAMGYGPLAVAPMIVYHALQLLIDTPLVGWCGRPLEPNSPVEKGDRDARNTG